MTDRQLIMMDGTTIDECSVTYDTSLWIYCPLTMRQAADIFLDTAKTQEIRYVMPDIVKVFRFFTDVQILNVVPGGVRVLLTGENAEETDEPREDETDVETPV